jgi:hypothetical protein
VSLKSSACVKHVALLALPLLLSACTRSELRLQPDFGVAIKQDLAAQIADPDAHYTGVPAPGSDGSRVSLAQTRYQTDAVLPPASISGAKSTTSSMGSAGSSAGSAVPASPSQP